MHTSDVRASTRFTATGGLTAAENGEALPRARVKAIYFSASVAGTLTFREGSATGTTKFVLDMPAANEWIEFPGDGILFREQPHVTVTGTLTGATVFYA